MITLRTLVCAGLCASLFSACQNDKRLPGSPVEYFGSVMPITGTEVLDLDSSEAFLPKAIAVRDSVVFVQCQGSKDVVISVDLRDNTRKVLLRKGNGPGEVLQMSAFSPSGDRENYGRRKQQAIPDRNSGKQRLCISFFPFFTEKIRPLFVSRRG